jgi:nucleotide-binding universal stress UspA family protein
MLSGELTAPSSIRYRVVRNVSPAAGILDFLDANLTDLVVMGTHGRSPLSHFLLGSVAERIVRHANCPVLTVGHARKNYHPHYKNILIPFDFSKQSKQAVRLGVALANQFKATVKVLHILEQEVHPAYFDNWRKTVDLTLPEIKEDARLSLEETLADETMEGVEFCVQAGGGKAHREIARFSKEHNIDLIIMATHGLSGLEHVLVGSTTERVVRIAQCPVLTFKPKPELASGEPSS